MILTFITNSTVLFGVTFCAIDLTASIVVRIVHIFKLDIRCQAIFLGCALVHRLLSGVQLRLIGLLGRLRKATVIDCSCDINLI